MPAWRYYELFMKRLPELQFVGMHVLSKHLGIGEVCHSTLSSDLSNWLTWLGCVQVERAHKKTKSIVHTKKPHQLKAKNVQREVRASVNSLAFTPCLSRCAHEDVCRDAPRSLSTTTRGRSTITAPDWVEAYPEPDSSSDSEEEDEEEEQEQVTLPPCE